MSFSPLISDGLGLRAAEPPPDGGGVTRRDPAWAYPGPLRGPGSGSESESSIRVGVVGVILRFVSVRGGFFCAWLAPLCLVAGILGDASVQACFAMCKVALLWRFSSLA